MEFRTKYAKEMNEIKADVEFKNTIITRATSNAAGIQTVAHRLRSKVGIIIASSVILLILILTIETPIIFKEGEKESNVLSNLFQGFAVTAYAADGTSVIVSPDVEFPIGQYSLIMSNVPGFPITITCQNADDISLRASEGMLLSWYPSVSKIERLGKEAAFKSGTTIYWTPLVEGSRAQKAILELTAYKDNKKLGSRLIEISTEDHIMYKGKLTSK
ncbi:hypothetical protein [Paenibacillus sp. FJAT-26967]|uniref:hypothetical protein n=1 Tax=Paenibacillus sp. FJAT-26967 TaxID=1729690 RepID=UPI0008387E6F|nr:hypothetical protein [Paenibacillus sp. FJAT-26967]